ncbi:hypothetical protein HOY80DRAFT_1064413 [Tuber brumale]|nr:hypothetical protein HOY80DRAFT_1064413 [Tuber brumale]
MAQHQSKYNKELGLPISSHRRPRSSRTQRESQGERDQELRARVTHHAGRLEEQSRVLQEVVEGVRTLVSGSDVRGASER